MVPQISIGGMKLAGVQTVHIGNNVPYNDHKCKVDVGPHRRCICQPPAVAAAISAAAAISGIHQASAGQNDHGPETEAAAVDIHWLVPHPQELGASSQNSARVT